MNVPVCRAAWSVEHKRDADGTLVLGFVTARCSVNPYRRWDGGERDNKLKAAELKVTTHQSWESGEETSGNGIIAGERGEREGAIKLEWESLDGGEKGSEESEAHMSDSNCVREREREGYSYSAVTYRDRWVSAVCGELPPYLVIKDPIKMVP